MKIEIMGYSGSGKSTLARTLAERLGCEVLHLDRVQFLPNWEERPTEEKQKIVSDFLDTHDAWVVDGTYAKLSFERRLQEADVIVVLLFNRFNCLYRTLKRYCKYRHTSRPDVADGCEEKYDWEFFTWVLYKGRGRCERARFKDVCTRFADKTFVLFNQKQSDRWLADFIKRVK